MDIQKPSTIENADHLKPQLEMTSTKTSGKFPKVNQDADRNTEVPDLVKAHDKVRADIAAMKRAGGDYPAIKNALNPADSKIEHARETTEQWTIGSPFKLEEFVNQSTDYRGQGLLPSDEMENGYRVKDRSKLSEPKYPAGKE